MTPAQAYGHPNFIDDVATQGPTDEGLRRADCIQQQKLSGYSDCTKGVVPMWTQQALTAVRGQSAGYVAGVGELVSFGGRGALGFALEAAGDPEIWTKLSTAQQTWVANTLRRLNDKIVSTTGSKCPTWNPSVITAVAGCFQIWFNANYGGKLTDASGKPVVLRADGAFDQQTLDALRTVVATFGATEFPDPFPGTQLPGETGTGEKKLSTGAMVGIAVAGATVIGGGLYLATHKKKR